MSLVLRHKPEEIGLLLDDQGWANLDELIAKACAHGQHLDKETVARIVAGNDKKRFAISADGCRIRANQGHSIEIELGLPPVAPPPVLYHGTAERNLSSIRAAGLVPGARQHVHLSADAETAKRVGARHGKAVVLMVDSDGMHRAGQNFYRAENGVWLTDAVPAEFLRFPSD